MDILKKYSMKKDLNSNQKIISHENQKKSKVPISFPSSSSKYDEEYYKPTNAKKNNSITLIIVFLMTILIFCAFLVAAL